MPTNEERRKVAARLRVLASHKAADEDLTLDALGLYRGENIEGFDINCVMELADLIEPEQESTCKIKQAYFDSDEEIEELMDCIAGSPEDTVVCICSSCGCDFRFDRGIKPSYCPFCGAKVVRL